jgi:hypothetical protein
VVEGGAVGITGDEAGAVGPLIEVGVTKAGDAGGVSPADAGAGDDGGDGPGGPGAGDVGGDGPTVHDSTAGGDVEETGAEEAGDEDPAHGDDAGRPTSIGGTACTMQRSTSLLGPAVTGAELLGLSSSSRGAPLPVHAP